MISVEVDNYCENCEEFEPKSYTSVVVRLDKNPIEKSVRTNIICRHRDKCREIYERAYDSARYDMEEEREDE